MLSLLTDEQRETNNLHSILILVCFSYHIIFNLFFPGRLGCFLLWFFKDLRGWLCDEIVDNKLDIYYTAKQTILFNRIIVKYTKNLISTENNGASFLTVFKFIFPNYRCTSTAKFSSFSDIFCLRQLFSKLIADLVNYQALSIAALLWIFVLKANIVKSRWDKYFLWIN